MMAKAPLQPLAPQIIAEWFHRYGEAQARLAAEPEGPWAWLWSIRRDILRYLLHRYGDAVTVRELMELEDLRPPSMPTHTRRVSGAIGEGLGPGRPLRPASTLRAVLGHLQRVNAEARYERLDPRQRIVRLSYPEPGLPTLSAALRDEQERIVRQELEQIADLLPPGEALSEEQILGVLSGDD